MMYRLLIFLLVLSACQRKSVPDQNGNANADIDTSAQLLTKDEIPNNALADVHHLLRLGYEKADKDYDSLVFQLYLDHTLQDSIRIQASGNDTVYLSIGNKQNRSVALYSYLDLLGYRFYGPEDHWTYFPRLDDMPFTDTILVSYFKLRRLLPSFSLSRRNIKPLQTSKELFSRWNDRLRMGSLIAIPAGHYGSTFNVKYKEEIIAHPEWRGVYKDGNPRDWNSNLKLCYSHPEVIELYKKDALLRLKTIKKNSNPPYFVNMEPPDGDGFCTCERCGSISNQVYGLANEVAEYLYTIDTNSIIALYGYNEHAKAPPFNLHKNILVGIVPFAFQGVGSPEMMMKEWENTGAKLYLRDYLAIPVWNFDKPTYDPNGNPLSKIVHLKINNYLGYSFETTASFMAVGLQFHLLSSSNWSKTDPNVEYTNFLVNMFPGYEEDITLIYQNLPYLNRQNFGSALESLREIKQKSLKRGETSITSRVDDLEFYIEYLYLLSEFQTSKTKENVNVLLDKILTIVGNRLLHPYGLYRVLQRDINLSRPIELTQNAPIKPIEAETPLTLRRNTSVSYQAVNPNFYLDSVETFIPIPIRNTSGVLFVGNNHDGVVKFRARLKTLNSSASGVIIIRDEKNNHVMDISLTPDNKWRNFEISLEMDKLYNIQFRTPGSELFFQGPNRPFVFTNRLYTKYIYSPVSFYFKVPEFSNDVRIQVPRKSNKVIVKSGDNTLYHRSQNPKAYVLHIKEEAGQIIEVSTYRHGLRLLDMPQLLGLHPKGVIYKTQN